MQNIIFVLVGIFALWRAYMNYEQFTEATKKYGDDWKWPKGMPNYGARTWLWGLLGFLLLISCFR